MTSGLIEYYVAGRENGFDFSSLHFFSVDTAIQASLTHPKLLYQPGEKWRYSNVNYMLLTKIVAQISGKKFSQFAKERIFEPLGMSHTLIHDDITQVIPNRSQGYNNRDADNTDWMIDNGYIPAKGTGYLQTSRNSPHHGGSGIFTTLNDWKKWIDNFETKKLGGQGFYDLMHQTMAFPHGKDNDAFGLAFGNSHGHEMVFYDGGDWGYSSFMMRFPQQKLSVVCFSNLGTGRAQDKAKQALDILLEDGIISLD